MRDMRKCERELAQLAFSSQHFFLRRISIHFRRSGDQREREMFPRSCGYKSAGISSNPQADPARASTSS